MDSEGKTSCKLAAVACSSCCFYTSPDLREAQVIRLVRQCVVYMCISAEQLRSRRSREHTRCEVHVPC